MMPVSSQSSLNIHDRKQIIYSSKMTVVSQSNQNSFVQNDQLNLIDFQVNNKPNKSIIITAKKKDFDFNH